MSLNVIYGVDPAEQQAALAKRNALRDGLAAQVAEREAQKQRQQQAEQARVQQELQEMAGYNPWGKGGGGAALTNAQGDSIADLRGVQQGDSTGTSAAAPARSRMNCISSFGDTNQ